MNFVIPMAGLGSRFTKAGYNLPKMMIEAKGKTLLEWSIDSLPLELCSSLICVMLTEHEEKFNLSAFIFSKYANRVDSIKFVFLDEVTKGQAETVYLAKAEIDSTKDLVIFNIDTAFSSNTLAGNLKNSTCDGVLGAFLSSEDRFSYAKVDEVGIVVETAEKIVLSDFALTGLYHFKKPSDFYSTYEYHLKNEIQFKGEYYIAPMYNYLIENGLKFSLDLVETLDILGTPDELAIFIAK